MEEISFYAEIDYSYDWINKYNIIQYTYLNVKMLELCVLDKKFK